MLRFDLLSVKTIVSLVFKKILSVFRTWKNCEFVCKNKLNYFVRKFQFLETLLFNKFLVINKNCLVHVYCDYFSRKLIGKLSVSHELKIYSRLSLNGHLYKTDTSVKRTPKVGPCLSLLLLFDSLEDGHLSKMDT